MHGIETYGTPQKGNYGTGQLTKLAVIGFVSKPLKKRRPIGGMVNVLRSEATGSQLDRSITCSKVATLL